MASATGNWDDVIQVDVRYFLHSLTAEVANLLVAVDDLLSVNVVDSRNASRASPLTSRLVESPVIAPRVTLILGSLNESSL